MKTIQLTPSCKDYLWGGEKLRTEYGIQSELHPLSEAWMLSCHPDGPSYLPDGSTFQQYINTHPGCLGTHCEKFSEFPVLAKLIDAKKDLSIQVHPSNEYALEHEHQYGKTEMWYVLEAEPGASLYYGFTHEISKEEFERRIQDNTLTDVLNAVPVHKGDCFFIPSGTLHAIRKGIVVAEIQQNSNVTYRIYDYGRLGADGKPRQLHIPQALDVHVGAGDLLPACDSSGWREIEVIGVDGDALRKTLCQLCGQRRFAAAAAAIQCDEDGRLSGQTVGDGRGQIFG